jgi:hypothetical protein
MPKALTGKQSSTAQDLYEKRYPILEKGEPILITVTFSPWEAPNHLPLQQAWDFLRFQVLISSEPDAAVGFLY